MACTVLYCVTLCILVFSVECVTVSNVVFIEGTTRKCRVTRLMLHCVWVYILVFGFECVMVSNILFMAGTYREAVLHG